MHHRRSGTRPASVSVQESLLDVCDEPALGPLGGSVRRTALALVRSLIRTREHHVRIDFSQPP